MQYNKWKCSNCQNDEIEEGQFAATGNGVSTFFNVQNKKFVTVTCTHCKDTKIYKTDTSTMGNILDFFGNRQTFNTAMNTGGDYAVLCSRR
ncbi:MAG: zinc ribbon domain-containing protein [Thermodesulfobacteriota bacterium]|nr:zinc ribbon domain-containing protein [Thermodesulfobacteriota bacterium]